MDPVHRHCPSIPRRIVDLWFKQFNYHVHHHTKKMRSVVSACRAAVRWTECRPRDQLKRVFTFIWRLTWTVGWGRRWCAEIYDIGESSTWIDRREGAIVTVDTCWLLMRACIRLAVTDGMPRTAVLKQQGHAGGAWSPTAGQKSKTTTVSQAIRCPSDMFLRWCATFVFFFSSSRVPSF